MRTEAVRRALLVGINNYPDPRNNLKGCVNDVLMMGKLITENFGFSADNIRLLTDARATTANIRDRLEWLVEGAGPGSVLLFHYSGHGSQVRDRNGDELEDHLDEIICPYDLDWDNPFTDDDFADLIANVQDGVNFTLVLDCCHSGSGTRQFFKELPAHGQNRGRFLVPPPDVAFRMAAGVELDPGSPERTVNMVGTRAMPTRKFGSSLTEQNAIVITGCRSDQTSADAWIESDFHGALTYSLVQSIRGKNYGLSYSDLIATAGGWLETNNYEQVPQLETRQVMQGWGVLNTQPFDGPGVPLVMQPATDQFKPPAEARVLFVHGMGNYIAGYSDRWRTAFNRYLGLRLDQFTEVVWDDVFNARAMGAEALPALTPDEERRARELTEELRSLVEGRHEIALDMQDGDAPARLLLTDARDRSAQRSMVNWLTNFDEYIGDFSKYLASERVRAAVDARLSSKLLPLLRSDVPTVLITHSWGTVVAHHTISAITEPPRPALHCTLGSPLWMLPVRRMLEFDNRTRSSDYWVNIDARGDLIGGPLAGKYAVDEDHLVPVVGDGNPHGSYFDPDNTEVQRAIVARAISEIGAH